MSISRRHLLRHGLAVAGAGGAAAISIAARAQTKASQSAVHYQNTPKDGHSCATCQFFQPPDACKVVDGTISAAGWCDLWVKKA
jgi:hypothetical protein